MRDGQLDVVLGEEGDGMAICVCLKLTIRVNSLPVLDEVFSSSFFLAYHPTRTFVVI